MTSFYDVIKIMSPKIRHQNDVTKVFNFQDPSLANSWLRSSIHVELAKFLHRHRQFHNKKLHSVMVQVTRWSLSSFTASVSFLFNRKPHETKAVWRVLHQKVWTSTSEEPPSSLLRKMSALDKLPPPWLRTSFMDGPLPISFATASALPLV